MRSLLLGRERFRISSPAGVPLQWAAVTLLVLAMPGCRSPSVIYVPVLDPVRSGSPPSDSCIGWMEASVARAELGDSGYERLGGGRFAAAAAGHRLRARGEAPTRDPGPACEEVRYDAVAYGRNSGALRDALVAAGFEPPRGYGTSASLYANAAELSALADQEAVAAVTPRPTATVE